tara:strand:+ start:3653 stop:3877 length:225 start_codon:yes stop_codon:yes gene_type:complete
MMSKEIKITSSEDQVYVYDQTENPKQVKNELAVSFYFDKGITKTDAMVTIAELLVDTDLNDSYSLDMWTEGFDG